MNLLLKKPVYRFYIDEMGNHHFPKNKDDIPNRFLCLSGVIFKNGIDYNSAARMKQELIYKHWPEHNPDIPVIFHREEIVHKRGMFGILQSPAAENAFNQDMLYLFRSMNCVFISVVLDKLAHKERYRDTAYEPYEWCLAGPSIQRKILFEKGFRNDYPGTFNENLYDIIKDKTFHNNSGDITNWGETFLP